MSLITKFNKMLAGWPGAALTGLLIGLSAIGLLVAWRGNPELKAALAAYWLLP